MTKVTAIISAYYAEKYLEDRLNNLIEQEDLGEIITVCQKGSKEYEILVRCLSDVGSQYKKVMWTDNIPTIYDAWNMAIEKAECDYITNANCDDLLYPGALTKLAEALDNNPKAAAAYGNQDIYDIKGEKVGIYDWAEGDFDKLMQGCFLGPMPMWRKSLHDKYGGFDAEMHSAGDYEFWLKIASQGETFHKVKGEPIGRYLKRKDSAEHRTPVRAIHETARAKARYRKDDRTNS